MLLGMRCCSLDSQALRAAEALWGGRGRSPRLRQARSRGCCAQAYEGAAQIVMAGTDSVLRAMESYTKQAWVLHAWQDVFVDLVQGQLQHLYTSLLSSEAIPIPLHLATCCMLWVLLWGCCNLLQPHLHLVTCCMLRVLLSSTTSLGAALA